MAADGKFLAEYRWVKLGPGLALHGVGAGATCPWRATRQPAAPDTSGKEDGLRMDCTDKSMSNIGQ